jgi:uncharacterized repeat protein (TIGR03809 family)
MTHLGDVARGRDTVARWSNLAEKRLEHLTDMFETGRWRRFHNEQAFLENIREAKAAVETWRDLMARDAAPDHLDLTGKHLMAARHEEVREQVVVLVSEPEPIVVEPLREIPDDVLAALESHLLDSEEMPDIADAPDLDDMVLTPLDLDSIQRRYPLLHNAL